MEITLIGYILIPLGLISFIFKPRWLFYIFIFFTPFTASSVVNIKSITFGLQPAYWFGILWMVYGIIKLLRNPIYITKTQKKYIVLVFLFWLLTLMSLMMPIIMDSRIQVHYPEGSWGFSDLEFKRTHITQFLYLTYVLLVLIFTVFEVKTKEKLIKSFRVLIYSTIFTLMWGLFQFVSYYLNVRYPQFLFNNNIGFSQQWGQTIFGVKRINSVSGEPSMYAFYLLMIVSIFIVLRLNKIYLINTRIFNIIIITHLAILILTISTTAYLGFIFFLSMLIGYYLYVRGTINYSLIKIIFLLLVIVFLGGMAYILISDNSFDHIIQVIRIITIDKMNNISGIHRFEGFKTGLDIFYHSPILGVGWGSNRTFDLGTTLLSNIGVIGFLLFIGLMYFPIKTAKEIHFKYKKDKLISNLSLSLLLSMLSGLFVLLTSVPDIIFLYFWLIIGLIMSLPMIILSDS